jgi:predicted homoserine dehydrogenase-like protein
MSALPIGLSEGRRLLRDIAKDEVISFSDVEDASTPGIVENLWQEQNATWPVATCESQSSQQPVTVR